MNLVNDVDFERRIGRRVSAGFAEFTNRVFGGIIPFPFNWGNKPVKLPRHTMPAAEQAVPTNNSVLFCVKELRDVIPGFSAAELPCSVNQPS